MAVDSLSVTNSPQTCWNVIWRPQWHVYESKFLHKSGNSRHVVSCDDSFPHAARCCICPHINSRVSELSARFTLQNSGI